PTPGGTATCSDTTESLREIFGSDVSLISTLTGPGSLQLSGTDPLANIDVLYNAGQAFPTTAGTQSTARARLISFFTRGGGYIATAQSGTGFTFTTNGGPGAVLVGGTFTGTS